VSEVDLLPRDRRAEARVAERARALVVGEPVGFAPDALAQSLDLRRGSIDDALAAVESRSLDLVLLDGRLPAACLTRLLEPTAAVGEDDRRPVIVVITEEGRRTNVESRLVGAADDFVNGARGPEVLLARVGRALKVRAALQELTRKNVELEGLYARMESLAARMGDELRLAAHLQRGLLPPAFQDPRLDVAREFLPFREIGGDYYDLVPLSPDRIAFAIGDVMGKGVPAALLAANLKACLRAQLQASDAGLEQLVERVNRLFWEVTPKGLFASLVFGVLDLAAGRLEYVNAGHDQPFLVARGGGIHDLDAGGTVLGLIEGASYERGDVAIGSGDVLVLYSDGITDRTNAAGDAYGVERLKEAALRARRDGARLGLYSLLGEVQGWADGSPAEDDMTLVVAKIL
jgi:serine phosphatase RsbU (regulator of sigma subunit)